MKRILLITFMLFSCMIIYAQNTISGTILDGESGEGLPGVTIQIKGTTSGASTDFNGSFSLSASADDILVISYVGYVTQEITVGNRTTFDITLQSDSELLEEVVVVGYGTQDKKEITSAVVSLDEESFNIGNINNPSQLLQGKVAGLSVYQKGSDPNSSPTIRLRGISTVGSNTEPLVVIDGVIGASLDNVDPNDIASINVLKDGSAAAIYGSRGSSGVILVTTKQGKRGGAGISATYDSYVAAATVARNQPVMTRSEYIDAGGNDLGSNTDWQDEVTRTGISHVHNIAISGGSENTTYRFSTNFRDIDGILDKSGFDQINARAAIDHYALNDRLNIKFNISLTERESNFSFNEALRYAVLYNPTAPIRLDNGEFFQAILFDNFNPVAILEQNQNLGKRKNLNFNAQFRYDILDYLSVTANYAKQYVNNFNGEFYPESSFFRGLNRGGLARRFTSDTEFTLFESFLTYDKSFDNANLTVTGGYSFQEDTYEDLYVEAGDFPSDIVGFNILETSGDLVTGSASGLKIASNQSPEERIIAFFGRLNATIDKGIYFNASIRREGSTKLGKDNQWGTFPAFGAGIDISQYVITGPFNALKLRAGYGVTGSLPRDAGLSQDLYKYSADGGGTVSFDRAGNEDLKWEEKAETNLGLDFSAGKINGSIDVYNRDINDFILEREVETSEFGTNRRVENAGKLNTQGIEVALNYTSVNTGDFSWTPGIVLSSYKTTLDEFEIDESTRGNLGAPGQNGTNIIRVAVGEEIGQIWGPRFAGVNDDGTPTFADLNGDGIITTDQGSAILPEGDFEQLGSGIPDIELGWTNQMTYKNWDLNMFFRAAFGHSLVNTYRAFYEPIDPGAINSYNRIKSDEQLPDLEVAQFSSLYVEKANFFRLDNVTLGYSFDMSNSSAFSRIRLYFNVQNAFTITGYQGIDPDPVLQDLGTIDNGGVVNDIDEDGRPDNRPDVLAPGIDRRYNYFTARTFTFGVNIGF
ncbi:MAG: SusC/RagA family TonB-linked outer membrane protein [Ekhidna sp.]|nr:SusC/RagA family TonB-linked outer membrane protein [Ekhidna sp.]